MIGERMKAGERLVYGGRATESDAAAYNAMSDRIAAFERAGRSVPDELLNGRHNLYISAALAAREHERARKAASRKLLAVRAAERAKESGHA